MEQLIGRAQSLVSRVPNVKVSTFMDESCSLIADLIERGCALKGDFERLVTSAKAWELQAKGYGKVIDSLGSDELCQLERSIAYHAARSDIECYCKGNWGNAAPGEIWYDVGSTVSDEEKDFAEKAVRYLESRKLLKRHPENHNLVRPLDVEVVRP